MSRQLCTLVRYVPASSARIAKRCLSTPAPVTPQDKKEHQGSSANDSIESIHRVDAMEKRFLVWSGHYAKVEDVPDFVKQGKIDRSRNVMRVRGSIALMVFATVGALVTCLAGRKEAARITDAALEHRSKQTEEK